MAMAGRADMVRELLQERALLPNDMLGDIGKAAIVITNYHAFQHRPDGTRLAAGGTERPRAAHLPSDR
jgi:hypothetical protein